jgi:RNA polymerase sigma-70 factor (ECF subfamily)
MRDQTSEAGVAELLEHFAWVRRLARGLVHDETLADDLVQETWLAALRSPPRAGEPPRPWLAEVLRNAARMRFRGEGRRRKREELVAKEARDADYSDLVETVETQRLLAGELLALPAPYRATLLLRYFEGLSAAEIAIRQGVPAATVRGRIKDGLARLRARLDERPGGRGAWLGALMPLANGSRARSFGAAAGKIKGALLMKGTQAAIVVAAVGGALFVVAGRGASRETRTVPTALPAARTTATTDRHKAEPPGHASATPPPVLPRLDHAARAEMLRRLADVKHQAQSSASAPPTVGEAQAGELDKEYIRQQIKVLLPQISECYTNALQRDASIKGRMIVNFSIVGDPSVGGLVGESKVDAEKSTVSDPDMRECVQETMYGAQFPAPQNGGSIEVTYPFVFKSSAEDPDPDSEPLPPARLTPVREAPANSPR